jgi:hypothetical protein
MKAQGALQPMAAFRTVLIIKRKGVKKVTNF